MKQLKYVLKRYKKFSIYSAPSNYIHTAGNNIPIVLLASWFGSQWYEAGIYARSISVMVYFDFVVSPLGRILEVFERQREGFLFNSVKFGMVLVAFFLAKTFRLNSYGTVMLYSVTSAIIYILLFFMVKKTMNLEIKYALNSNKQI